MTYPCDPTSITRFILSLWLLASNTPICGVPVPFATRSVIGNAGPHPNASKCEQRTEPRGTKPRGLLSSYKREQQRIHPSGVPKTCAPTTPCTLLLTCHMPLAKYHQPTPYEVAESSSTPYAYGAESCTMNTNKKKNKRN